MKELVVIGGIFVALSQHQVFGAVDDMPQSFRGACGEIVPVGTLSGYRPSALMLQQGTAIADVGLHLVDIDSVSVRAVAGNSKQGVLSFYPGKGLCIVTCLDISQRYRFHGVLTLTEVEWGMVDFQHVVNIVQRCLETLCRFCFLAEIELALTNHFCYIVKTRELVAPCFSQLLVEDVGFAEDFVVALHVAQQAEIVLAGIVIALEVALIFQFAGADIGQFVIEVQRLTVLAAGIIGDGAIEETPDF